MPKILPEQKTVKAYRIPDNNPPANLKGFDGFKPDEYTVTTERPNDIMDPNLRFMYRSLRGEPTLIVLRYHGGILRDVTNLPEWDSESSFRIGKAED